MDRDDFMAYAGRIAAQSSEGEEFVAKVRVMMSLLDEGDQEDFYGTEGWRHIIGLEY